MSDISNLHVQCRDVFVQQFDVNCLAIGNQVDTD